MPAVTQTAIAPESHPHTVPVSERGDVCVCLSRTNCKTSTVRTIQDALLLAKDLRKSFGGQVVLDGIDLELRRGEVVLLRGENGSGKTTLLNILTGNLEPDEGTIDYLSNGTPRSYTFPRRWWQEINPFDHFTPEFVAHEGIGRTWQDVRLFGAQSLRDNIVVAEPGQPGENPLVALIASGRANRRETDLTQQADSMLARLGLGGRESSSADKISLGQLKRVAIARAVAAGAKILFLDEPLAGLDQKGIADVLSLLESLVREHDLTLVIVEHVFNQSHLHGLVTMDWLLENGTLHRNGGSAKQPITNPGQSTAGPGRPAWFHLLAGDDAEIIDEPLPRGALLTRIRRPNRWKPGTKAILEIKGLVVNRGSRTVIGQDDHRRTTGFNLSIDEGEIAVLQAPNGWGKSTLQAAVCGMISIASGTISLCGNPLQNLRVWERVRKGLIALPAEDRLFQRLTGDEVSLLAGDSVSKLHGEGFMGRVSSSMSGGEMQRLMLSTLDSFRHGRAHLLILDEPFAALDENAVPEAVQLISGQSSPVLVLMPSSSA